VPTPARKSSESRPSSDARARCSRIPTAIRTAGFTRRPEERGTRAAFALPGHRRGFDLHDLPRVGLYRKDGSLRTMLKTAGVARR